MRSKRETTPWIREVKVQPVGRVDASLSPRNYLFASGRCVTSFLAGPHDK